MKRFLQHVAAVLGMATLTTLIALMVLGPVADWQEQAYRDNHKLYDLMTPRAGHPWTGFRAFAQGPVLPAQAGLLQIGNLATATATATLTLNQIVGTLVGTPGAAATYTTPTATAICAALGPYNTPGFGWYWDITQGATTFTITVAGGTGVTLLGTGTAASANTRQFKFEVDNCSNAPALELYSLNTSAR